MRCTLTVLAVMALAVSAYASDVKLGWTAPGDDGNVGIAAEYDIRYSTDSMVIVNWSSAVQVSGEPIPDTAGTYQTHTVMGLNHGTTYYFALKTQDEAFNWSQMSNIPRVMVDTLPPGAIIDMGRIPN